MNKFFKVLSLGLIFYCGVSDIAFFAEVPVEAETDFKAEAKCVFDRNYSLFSALKSNVEKDESRIGLALAVIEFCLRMEHQMQENQPWVCHPRRDFAGSGACPHGQRRSQSISGLTLHNGGISYVQRCVVPQGGVCWIVGDIHGYIDSVDEIRKKLTEIGALDAGGCHVEDGNHIIFIGDYVDRGNQGMAVLMQLLKLKNENWDSVYLIRGNHEISDVNENIRFKNDFLIPVRIALGASFYTKFILSAFGLMPSALAVDYGNGYILCSHGGLPLAIADTIGLITTLMEQQKAFVQIPKDFGISSTGFSWHNFVGCGQDSVAGHSHPATRNGNILKIHNRSRGGDCCFIPGCAVETILELPGAPKTILVGHDHSGIIGGGGGMGASQMKRDSGWGPIFESVYGNPCLPVFGVISSTGLVKDEGGTTAYILKVVLPQDDEQVPVVEPIPLGE
jgi:hypothetical protein